MHLNIRHNEFFHNLVTDWSVLLSKLKVLQHDIPLVSTIEVNNASDNGIFTRIKLPH